MPVALPAGVSDANNLRSLRSNGGGSPAEICFDPIDQRFARERQTKENLGPLA